MKGDKKRARLVVFIIGGIALALILLYCLIFAVATGPMLPVAIVFIAIFGGLAYGVIAVMRERIQEIKEENEDDYRNY